MEMPPFLSCLDNALRLKHNPDSSAGSTVFLMFARDTPSSPVPSQRDALVLILQNSYLRHGDPRQATLGGRRAEQAAKTGPLGVRNTSCLCSCVQAQINSLPQLLNQRCNRIYLTNLSHWG